MRKQREFVKDYFIHWKMRVTTVYIHNSLAGKNSNCFSTGLSSESLVSLSDDSRGEKADWTDHGEKPFLSSVSFREALTGEDDNHPASICVLKRQPLSPLGPSGESWDEFHAADTGELAGSIKSDLLARTDTYWWSFKGLVSPSWTWANSLEIMSHIAFLASMSSDAKGKMSRRPCKKSGSGCI